MLTRIANIAMGLCWEQNVEVNIARNYATFMLKGMMIYLNVPDEDHSNIARYILDMVVTVYYFANGSIRIKPTIYAELPFRDLTK